MSDKPKRFTKRKARHLAYALAAKILRAQVPPQRRGVPMVHMELTLNEAEMVEKIMVEIVAQLDRRAGTDWPPWRSP